MYKYAVARCSALAMTRRQFPSARHRFSSATLPTITAMPPLLGHAHQLPPAAELASLLQQPLPCRVPLDSTSLAAELFAADAPLLTGTTLHMALNLVDAHWSKPFSAVSEMEMLCAYDMIVFVVHRVCEGYPLELSFARDRQDPTGSTLGRKRPDYLARVGMLPLLRGEEKRGGIKLAVPIEELTKKMRPWSRSVFGDLPYVFGYATSGNWITVVAINSLLRTVEILPPQDIFDPCGRVKVLKCFGNLARLFPTMVRLSKLPLAKTKSQLDTAGQERL